MKTLTTLLITLLVLGGCTSELDRCMEVQYDEEKYINELNSYGLCKSKDSKEKKICIREFLEEKKISAKNRCHFQGVY